MTKVCPHCGKDIEKLTEFKSETKKLNYQQRLLKQAREAKKK